MDDERVEPALSRQRILDEMEMPDRIHPDWLQREFPEDLQAICDLGPLRPNQNFAQFLIQLQAIIYLFRAPRVSKAGAIQAVRDLENGTSSIKRAIQGFAHVNYFLLGAALLDASKKWPRLKGLDAKQVLELLDEFCVVSSALSEVMRSAAGISSVPRRRGDKREYYFVPALPLIELWESITGKSVPTPRESPRLTMVGRN